MACIMNQWGLSIWNKYNQHSINLCCIVVTPLILYEHIVFHRCQNHPVLFLVINYLCLLLYKLQILTFLLECYLQESIYLYCKFSLSWLLKMWLFSDYFWLFSYICHRKLSLSTNCIEKIANLNGLSELWIHPMENTTQLWCWFDIVSCSFREFEDSIIRKE